MSEFRDAYMAHETVDPIDGRDDLRHPVLTPKWLEAAHSAARNAFELVMQRERRALDQEFDRFWREQAGREA